MDSPNKLLGPEGFALRHLTAMPRCSLFSLLAHNVIVIICIDNQDAFFFLPTDGVHLSGLRYKVRHVHRGRIG